MDKSANILNCLVVDDEPLAREVIRRFIERVPALHLVAECSNAIEAMTVLQETEVHLLFVDIQMPEILGTEFIKILKNPPKVIITTAYPQYALEGYELDVVDYLLKPIQFDRWVKAVSKAFQTTGIVATTPSEGTPKDSFVYFRMDRKMVKVMLHDIMYVESMKDYVKVFTTNGMIITKQSISSVEAMLPEKEFIRTHRSYIVAARHIKSFTSELIEVHDTEIPIGKLFKNEVMRSLQG